MGQKPDPYVTLAKYREMEAKLERMRLSRPSLASEVKRLAEMGDFSENAGYQLAKGRLRGLNQRMLDLEAHLKEAIVIQPQEGLKKVQIGSRVTLQRGGKERTYIILGSTETDPDHNVISYLSPLGAGLMGHGEGECVEMALAGKTVEYVIIKIEEI